MGSACPYVEHRFVEGANVKLHVACSGSGAPVILLHGFPENWTSWRRQIEPLVNAGFTVLAPDLRGYNLSERPRDRAAYHLSHLVEDVAALVRASGSARAHVVGHDWGGVIAWTFAGEHPELLDRLVILNAPHLAIYLRKVRRPPQLLRSAYVLLFSLPWIPERLLAARDYHAIRYMFRSLPARKGAFDEAAIAEYIEALRQPGALTAALDYYRALRQADAVSMARRARVHARTLVIWGERDPALGLELLDGIEKVAPSAVVHRIPASGHWVQNEAPDEVNAALISFLRSQE